MAPKVESVTDRYTAGARAYAEISAPILLPFGERLLEGVPLAGARRVLDLASGTGSLIPLLRRAAPRATVVAADAARGMLALGPADVPRALMDGCALAFAGGSFDAVVIAFAVFFFADVRRGLAEARRVLRPGGALALTSWRGDPTYGALLAWREEARAIGASFRPWPEDAIDPARLERAVGEAGFARVAVEIGPFEERYDREQFLKLRLAMSKPLLDKLAPEERAAFVARARARLDALDPDAFLDRTEVMYVRAT